MEHDENVIEAALRVAAADPSKRPDFYKALSEATVYVIGMTEQPGSGQTTLGAAEKVSILAASGRFSYHSLLQLS